MVTPDLASRAHAAFAADAAAAPALTLRGADAVDSYDLPPVSDPALDTPDDAYLERYAFWALPHLDAASWRHYLPRLIDYALRNLHEAGPMVIDGLLASLRPPDREPPAWGRCRPSRRRSWSRCWTCWLSTRGHGIATSPCRCWRSTGSRTRSIGGGLRKKAPR